MPPPIVDDFNRPNGGIGSNWTTWLNAGLIISGGEVRGNTNDISGGSYWSADSFDPDQYAQITMRGVLSADNLRGVGVRMQSGSNGYVLRLIDSSTIRLVRYDNGSPTDIQIIDVAWAIGDRIELRINVNTLRCFKNGIQIGSDVVDNTYTSGAPGIISLGNNDAKVDDFFADNLSSLVGFPFQASVDGQLV